MKIPNRQPRAALPAWVWPAIIAASVVGGIIGSVLTRFDEGLLMVGGW